MPLERDIFHAAFGNDNRKLTTCDHRILTTPGG
jgi:hypothetical protein